jgi:hypothetical protein
MEATMTAILNTFWKTNRAMTLLLLLTGVLLVIGVGGMIFDSRLISGAPAWAKTTKFALSFLLYIPTMLWMFSHVNTRPRLKSFVLTASAVILAVEMVMIMLQAVRGQVMHFNVSTPFNAALWGFMSVTIMIFYAISILGFIYFIWQKIVIGPMALAMKLGMALMIFGFGLGFLMTSPTPHQLVVLEGGGQPELIGAHTVGAADGGPGLPLLGWSTLHGDLRTAHFVGIHGAQAIPLAALIFAMLAARYHLTERHQRLLVWGAGAGYLGLILLVAWQAQRGQPLIAPDALTLGVFAALALVMAVFAGAVVLHAQRGTKAMVRAA